MTTNSLTTGISDGNGMPNGNAVSTKPDFSDISDEMLLYIMHYVGDTDLQALSRVNRKFHHLSSDIVLWRYFRLVRNAAMINSKLFGSNSNAAGSADGAGSAENVRPDRIQLVDRNIMRGVMPHQIERGQYVNNAAQISQFETQSRIDRQIKQRRLKNTLQTRPDSAKLQSIGVLPEGVSLTSSPMVAQQMLKLRRVISQNTLEHNLSNRRNIDELADANVMHSPRISRSLASTKFDLEKQFQGLAIHKKLSLRPTAGDLYVRNVLRGAELEDGNIVPMTIGSVSEMGVQLENYARAGTSARHQLDFGSRHQLDFGSRENEDFNFGGEDSNERIEQHEEMEMFEMEGVVPHHTTVQAKTSAASPLSRISMKVPILQPHIANRPIINDVEHKLSDSRGVALVVCPGVRPKIRLYEGMTGRSL